MHPQESIYQSGTSQYHLESYKQRDMTSVVKNVFTIHILNMFYLYFKYHFYVFFVFNVFLNSILRVFSMTRQSALIDFKVQTTIVFIVSTFKRSARFTNANVKGVTLEFIH